MRPWACRRTQAGVALLTALIVLALVTVATVAMAERQQLDISRTANLIDADQAYLQALGVESWAEGLLAQDGRRDGTDSLHDDWAHALPVLGIEGGKVAGTIEDLQGRFNLNDLRPPQAQPGAHSHTSPASETAAPAGGAALAAQRFRRLLAILGLDPGLTDALLDWLDADTETRYPNGAEDDWYLRQDPPYRAANRMMVSPSELLLVRGVTPAVYRRLRPFVTALPGYTAINVNTASPEVLMCLAAGVTRADAEAAVAQRTVAAFPTVQAFLELPALAGHRLDAAGLSVASSFFAVHAAARVNGLRVDLVSDLYRARGGGVQVISRVQGAPGDG